MVFVVVLWRMAQAYPPYEKLVLFVLLTLQAYFGKYYGSGGLLQDYYGDPLEQIVAVRCSS